MEKPKRGVMIMDLNEINEFKIERIEKQSKYLGEKERTLLMQNIAAGFGLGFSLFKLNPLLLFSSLVCFATAQSSKGIKKDIKEDIENLKSIKDQQDLEEYKVERIETCKKKSNFYEKTGNIYAISAALAMGGVIFASFAFALPAIVLAYGCLDSMLNEEFYDIEIKKLSTDTLQNESPKEKVKMKSRTPVQTRNATYGH